MTRSTRAIPVFAALAASALMTLPAHGQSVPEQIELGLELYLEGEYGAAITELEFAITDIRSAMSGGIASTFPPAPSGWSGMEVSSSGESAAMIGMLGGGTILERQYVEDGGQGRIEASLMIDSPMAQGLGAVLGNPALVGAQPNTERVRVGRETATLTWQAERGQAEAMMMLDGRILVRVEGSNLSSPDPVRELLQSWDLAALRAQAAR